EGLGLAELIDLRAGEADVVAVAATLVHKPNLHNAVGAWVRERVNQDGVDDAEDGAGGADSQSQGEHCGQREARTLPQFAGGVAQIRGQRLHRHLAWQPVRLRRPFGRIDDRGAPTVRRQPAPITAYLWAIGV